jgi:hypothetical protein
MTDLYDSGLNRKDWYLLRDAILSVSMHKGDSECKQFTELPNNLKLSEIGLLISKALYENDKKALDKAAKKMVGGADKAWLAFMKS